MPVPHTPHSGPPLPPGLCGMVAISWYAANITQDFFNPLYAGTK